MRVALFVLLWLGLGAAHAQTAHRYADAHLHYVDFFQESEGMDALLAAMDAGRVDHALLMGIPVTKKWHEDEPKKPRYYQGDDAPLYWYSATDVLVAEAIRRLPAAQQRRFKPFLSGFNPNDKNADAHIERMLALYPGFWKGIGEVFTRHDDLTALIQGEVPRSNNEALARVYRLAAKHDLPVLLHSNLTSVREREPLYLEELEEALSKHPKTRFLWAHAGTSAELNRAQGKLASLRETVEDLLARHDNLWIDLSWSVLDPYILDADGKPRAAWIALIEAHPDRFVIGSDLVGHFEKVGEKLSEFDVLLDALPAKVARKLAHDNLLALLPERGARTDEPPP
jgi:predicted TIM-barrel fold metal-dependent hydrolase